MGTRHWSERRPDFGLRRQPSDLSTWLPPRGLWIVKSNAQNSSTYSTGRREDPSPFIKHRHRARAPRVYTNAFRSSTREQQKTAACNLQRKFQCWVGWFSVTPEIMAKFGARAGFVSANSLSLPWAKMRSTPDSATNVH